MWLSSFFDDVFYVLLISGMVDKLTEKILTVYFTAKWVTAYDLLGLDFLGINRLVINSKQKNLTRGGLQHNCHIFHMNDKYTLRQV